MNDNIKQLLGDAVKLLNSVQKRLYGYVKNKYNDLKRYIDLSKIMHVVTQIMIKFSLLKHDR